MDGDVRVVGPEGLFVYLQRAAHERLGLRGPVRVLEQRRQVAQADGNVRMVGPEGLFVYLQRAAVQGLGLGEPRARVAVQPQSVHQPGRRVRDAERIGVRDQRRRVRVQRVPYPPTPHVIRWRVGGDIVVHQLEGRPGPRLAPAGRDAQAHGVLHQAVHGELLLRQFDHGPPVQLGQQGADVPWRWLALVCGPGLLLVEE